MPQAVEIELKFQVPAAARAALRRAVATASAQDTRLRAIYADTDDARLAAAGLALRLRKEGHTWVQTLKGRGDGLMQRLEHDVALPAQRGEPLLDPLRHAGSSAGAALAAALQGAPLRPQYRTDIQRTQRLLRRGSARIEVAFDEGHIVAGGQRLPVCELELELKAGSPALLLEVADSWVQRFGLWLDVRTKSERGFRLARDMPTVPAVTSRPARLPPDCEPHQAFAAAVMSSLAQALPNAAEIASGAGAAEHLHQLRVGLRRLRTALRLLGPWSVDPPAAATLEQALRPWFVRLGAARDDDAIEAAFGERLRAAGAPAPSPRPVAAEPVDVGAIVREPGLSRLMLDALRLAHAAAPPRPADPAPLRDAASRVLHAAWRAAMRDARGFADAPTVQQHRLRKRLKRLRYGAEFLLPLFPPGRSRRLMNRLRATLDELGHWNDLQVAQARFAAHEAMPDAAADPFAVFARAWLSAQRPQQLRRCVKALDRLAETPRFWR